ncbi:MAG: DUF1295 domain-containing protein [Candidatus Omnitrophota bacterium]
MIHLLLTAWSLVAVWMLVLWVIQVKTKNASYVDIGWTFGLLICAWVYSNQTGPITPRKVLILSLVALWAVRLGGLLILRLIKENKEDSRYAKIRADWKTHQDLKFFLMFQFQGLLDVILSWGYLVICLNPSTHFSILEYVAVIIWGIGFIGESIADDQLKRFKVNPSNKGRTCQSGLWNYSRHPNYYFEWLMWVAYFLMALSAPYGGSVVILPALMYYFLMHVSGVPLAEAQALRSKGPEYRQYQQTTSSFVPLPRRKL